MTDIWEHKTWSKQYKKKDRSITPINNSPKDINIPLILVVLEKYSNIFENDNYII